MKRAYLALRSAVLWILSIIHFFIAAPFLVFLNIFLDMRKHDWLQRAFCRRIAFLSGARVKVIRSPGFDPNRTSLFMSNHVNVFDPFMLYCAIPQLVRGWELESHFKIPAYGWLMKRFGNVPVPDVRRTDLLIAMGANPFRLGPSKCCALLKTKALLDALSQNGIDAAIGGARRDEEKSRAKERIFSFRDAFGQWDPKNQRPELWNLYNSRIDKGQSVRVFPLSNWTELDVWEYIRREEIPVVPLYFAKEREVVVRGDKLIIPEHGGERLSSDRIEVIRCRMRSLGCSHCSGAIRSEADSISGIIDELKAIRRSERENRLIDHDQEGSMELKKREGYF